MTAPGLQINQRSGPKVFRLGAFSQVRINGIQELWRIHLHFWQRMPNARRSAKPCEPCRATARIFPHLPSLYEGIFQVLGYEGLDLRNFKTQT